MNVSQEFNSVLQKANDGQAAAMSKEITDLLNSEWNKLNEALTAEGIQPVVEVSYSPDHDAFIAILEKYIAPQTNAECYGIEGRLENMNIVASIYNSINSENGEDELAVDMDYYYGDIELSPALYTGRELADGERVKKFDHIPTIIDIIKMCVEFNSGTPLFDIDKGAPFYDEIAPLLGAVEVELQGGASDQPNCEADGDPDLPPRIHGRGIGHPIVLDAPGGPDTDDDDIDEIPDDCQDCNPKDVCPDCVNRDKCAMPCYDPDTPDDEESGEK